MQVDKAYYEYTLDAGVCEEDVCIYAKDGQFEHAPNNGEGDVPGCAYSAASQTCQICERKVTVCLPPPLGSRATVEPRAKSRSLLCALES